MTDPALLPVLQKLVPQKDGEPYATMRTAEVLVDNGDGTLDIELSGVTVPNVPMLAGSVAAVSDIVLVVTWKGALLILGKISDGTPTDDTGWVDLTLINGWTTVGTQTPQVRRVGLQVHMRGRVEDGTGTIATIPAGFRPTSQPLSFTARQGGGNNVGIFIVNPSGDINPGGTLTIPNLTATWLVG